MNQQLSLQDVAMVWNIQYILYTQIRGLCLNYSSLGLMLSATALNTISRANHKLNAEVS